MTAEDAINDMQSKRIPTKEELRRSRTIAVVLAGSLVITLIAIVYAFIQQTEAKRQEAFAMQIMQRSKEMEYELVKVKEEMNQQRSVLEAERLVMIKALEDCKSSQKKK